MPEGWIGVTDWKATSAFAAMLFLCTHWQCHSGLLIEFCDNYTEFGGSRATPFVRIRGRLHGVDRRLVGWEAYEFLQKWQAMTRPLIELGVFIVRSRVSLSKGRE